MTYKMRNIIERAFFRLKDWRGIATRYDKKAQNFLAGVCLASAVTFWLQGVHTLAERQPSRAEPMTGRNLTLAIMEKRGLPVDDGRLVETTRQRVGARCGP